MNAPFPTASIQVIFFAIAFKTTSLQIHRPLHCRGADDPGFSNLQHRRRLVKRTFHVFVRPDISHTNDMSGHSTLNYQSPSDISGGMQLRGIAVFLLVWNGAATTTLPPLTGASVNVCLISRRGPANFVDTLIFSGLIRAGEVGYPVAGTEFFFGSDNQYGHNGIVTTVNAPPFISLLRPTSGPVGTLITVSGSGFTPTAGFRGAPGGGEDYGGNTVQIGSEVTLKNLNSADGMTVKFEIPPNLAPRVYGLTIVNQNGTSNSVNLTVTKKPTQ